ncbi:hypothetical protein EBE87_24460 [Pseudoroseomonas wenyumeiae]|uniref:Uncharacterized protein n=1 Tax=Teichococcus wenyumeiae TaxID=2478470 RepID=A0A3A9JAL5_9PROT|nr:tripartite tricarboxylate transporter substrate-binding protein [Pseudoroseomonas wenyumeiae]RKK03502.1 hypothetical protein D6Z83_14250 [Pseudoroseomonas wenyumeiae]RMI16997.1 hypothetical protein EBE87_24460 [Pseudoroseomonas wenyumeiae]
MGVLLHKDAPFHSLADLVAAAREKSNHFDYGSAGTGAPSQVLLLQILYLTGARMNHVVYCGAAPAMTDLMSGTITTVADTTTTALGNIRGGMVRPLAITSTERLPFLPHGPTVRESGVPGLAQLSMSTWSILLAPARTPQPILTLLPHASRDVMADPVVAAKFAEVGNVPMPPLDQTATQAFTATEFDR